MSSTPHPVPCFIFSTARTVAPVALESYSSLASFHYRLLPPPHIPLRVVLLTAAHQGREQGPAQSRHKTYLPNEQWSVFRDDVLNRTVWRMGATPGCTPPSAAGVPRLGSESWYVSGARGPSSNESPRPLGIVSPSQECGVS